MNVGDKVIDPLHGQATIKDVDGDGCVTLIVDATDVRIFRSAHRVQAYKKTRDRKCESTWYVICAIIITVFIGVIR